MPENNFFSFSQIEHLIHSIATIIGTSELILIALAAFTLLLLKCFRLVIEEYYDVVKVAREKKLSSLPPQDRQAPAEQS